MSKNYKREEKDSRYLYRMAFAGFPRALNYIFSDDAELADYEGNTYKVSVCEG